MIFDRIDEADMLRKVWQPLTSWFEQNKREMEWRSNPLPYYVWVSEIMLQQTRVETVRPYFHRFVNELPDIHALAECGEERLLKLWEGLGYYNRVRNMQKAARIVMEEYGGELPSDPALLRKLPGIGSYTAGAIASIACHIPAPAVDGNVLRVLSRLTGSLACIDDAKVKVHFEELIQELLDAEDAPDPGIFNQALMELGALVCLPGGTARCAQCPLREWCAALRLGELDSIPVRKPKKPRRIEKRTILAVRDASCTVIRKRPDSGLLAGLWELPSLEGDLTDVEALEEARRIGIRPVRILPLPEAKHIFSHVEWHMKGYLVLAEELEGLAEGYLAIEPERTRREYSIPAAYAIYTEYLNICPGIQTEPGGEF